MGAEIVNKKDFDLYILDADFPMKLNEPQRKLRTCLMENIRNGIQNNDFFDNDDYDTFFK